jgi:thiol-disulfide isomerase/thioredoxin
MNKYLFHKSKVSLLILFIVLTSSCKSKTESKHISISGRTDIDTDSIYLKIPNNYHVTGKFIDSWHFSINSNNTFAKTLDLPRGNYNLQVGNITYPIFLNKGYDLNILIENGKVKFKGYGAKEYIFLQQQLIPLSKQLSSINNYKYYSKLNEVDFLKLTDSIFNVYQTLVKSYDFDDTEFKYLSNLHHLTSRTHKYLNYTYSRKFIDPDYEVSNSYPDIFKDIDLKNEDFGEIPLFMMSLYTYSNSLSEKQFKAYTDPTIRHLNFVKNDTTIIKNDSIREKLMYVTAFFNMEQSNSLDTFYETYNTWAINTKLKQKIKKKYFKLKQYDIGSKASNFTFKNENNEVISLSDFKGKTVFLDIWATWCNPCIKEIEYSNNLQEKLKAENITFVSVCIQSDPQKWKQIIKKNEFKGVHLFCPDEQISEFEKKYLIGSLPRYVIIDKYGEIVDFNAKKPSNIELEKKLLILTN